MICRAQSKPNAKDLARIKALDAEIASSTEELEELQIKTGAIEAAIGDLEKKILEIGGSRLLKQKSTVDGIRLLHQLANEEITKAEVMRATAEKNIVKYTTGVETNSAALEEVEKELEELKDQLDEVAQYLEDLKEKVEAAQAAQESSKDDLDELKTQLQDKREEIDEFRKKEVGLLLCVGHSATYKLCSLRLPRSLTSRRKSLMRMNAYLITGGRNTTSLSSMTLSEPVYRVFHLFLLTATHSDDDDEEEEEVADQGAEASGSGEAVVKQEVKQESGGSAPSKKAHQHTSSNELYIYSAEELARFKRREIVADSEYLDGMSDTPVD